MPMPNLMNLFLCSTISVLTCSGQPPSVWFMPDILMVLASVFMSEWAIDVWRPGPQHIS